VRLSQVGFECDGPFERGCAVLPVSFLLIEHAEPWVGSNSLLEQRAGFRVVPLFNWLMQERCGSVGAASAFCGCCSAKRWRFSHPVVLVSDSAQLRPSMLAQVAFSGSLASRSEKAAAASLYLLSA
jgi:hypothetical protein